jgi:hypothetical protein
VTGRKRHIAVDTQGLLLGVVVHAASVQDADGMASLLARQAEAFTRGVLGLIGLELRVA